MGLTATYSDADTFTVVGDRTADFVVNRKVRCDCGVDGYKYGIVSASSYGDPNTTVDLTADSDNLTANLTDADWSVVKPGTAGNIPLHSHADEDKGGGSLVLPSTLYIGDTANANMTLGLTINQGTNDDEALALKSSTDVDHGITDYAETDTYAVFRKAIAGFGGLSIDGYSEDIRAFVFTGVATSNDTTKSTTGRGVANMFSFKKSVNGGGVNDADANLFCVADAGNTRFIFDKEGEMHSDAIIGVGDDWDEWDDLALASDLSRLPKANFSEMMKYKAEDFERAGLLTLSTDEDGNRHAFIKHKAMIQFAMCCFAEVAKKLMIYEQALLSLGAEPKLLEA